MADSGPLNRDEYQNNAECVAHRNNHIQKGDDSFGSFSINLRIISVEVL